MLPCGKHCAFETECRLDCCTCTIMLLMASEDYFSIIVLNMLMLLPPWPAGVIRLGKSVSRYCGRSGGGRACASRAGRHV